MLIGYKDDENDTHTSTRTSTHASSIDIQPSSENVTRLVLAIGKEEMNTELFFVTLNKSDKDFSASTMYDDYVVSENQFHWKSQNTDTHQGKGKRFVEQEKNKKKFLLFVRENKHDGFGNTCPFYCFGLVDYISSRDDKPMSIDWRMHQPILPQFIKAV